MVGRQDCDCLVDAMLLVLFKMFHPSLLDQFDHPTRVEVDTEANSSSILAEVFNGKSQATGAGGAEHQPIRTFRKIFVGKGVAKEFVIDPEVIDHNAAFGDSCRPTGLEDVGRFSCEAFWNPAFNRATAEPLVFEHRELLQVIKAFDFFERIKFQFRFFSKPEW